MDQKLKRTLRHKAGIYGLFTQLNILISFFLAILTSGLWQMFKYDSAEVPISFPVFAFALVGWTFFVYLVGRYTYSHIDCVSTSWQLKINKRLLDLEVLIKNKEEQIAKDPAPKGLLDGREADIYDAKREKERLIALYKELEKASMSFL